MNRNGGVPGVGEYIQGSQNPLQIMGNFVRVKNVEIFGDHRAVFRRGEYIYKTYIFTYIFNQNPKSEAKIGSFCSLNRKIEKIDDFIVENICSKFSIIYMISIHPLLWAAGRGFCPLVQKRNSGVLCTLEHAKYEATVKGGGKVGHWGGVKLYHLA